MLGPPPEGPFRLEVYYKLFNTASPFARTARPCYMAEYEVEVLVYEDGDQVTGTTFRKTIPWRVFRARSPSPTSSSTNQREARPPGTYELTLRLRDLRSGHAATSD